MTLFLSQFQSRIKTAILYPPNLEKLTLDYYFSDLHEGFIASLPKKLESLTMECGRFDYHHLATIIKDHANIKNLKISS